MAAVPFCFSSRVSTEDRAKADCCAIHQHKLARRLHTALFFQLLMNLADDLRSLGRVAASINALLLVLQHRTIEITRPKIKDLQGLGVDIFEAPAAISLDCQIVVLIA